MSTRPMSTPHTYRLVPKKGASNLAAPNSTASDPMPATKTSGSNSRARKSGGTLDRLVRRPLAGALVHRHRQLDLDLRVQVAGRPALGVGQPEPAQPDLRPVLRLRRHFELDATALQRRGGALASVERDVERPRHDDAQLLALAGEKRIRRHLDLRAQSGHPQHRSFFDSSGHVDLDPPAARKLDGAAGAALHLGQAHGDGHLNVERLSTRPALTASEDRPEEVAESAGVAEHLLDLIGRHGAVLHALSATATWSTAHAATAEGIALPRLHASSLRRSPVGTKRVVELLLLGIRQHFVRLRDLLEALLRLLVASVEVGMMLARKLPEGRADILLPRRPRQSEHLVVVACLGHCCPRFYRKARAGNLFTKLR